MPDHGRDLGIKVFAIFNAGQKSERRSSCLQEREPISATERQLGIDAQGHFDSARKFYGVPISTYLIAIVLKSLIILQMSLNTVSQECTTYEPRAICGLRKLFI